MLGGVLTLMGVAIVASGVRNFSRAATPVPSNQPVRALVTTGIHGWSRIQSTSACFSCTPASAWLRAVRGFLC